MSATFRVRSVGQCALCARETPGMRDGDRLIVSKDGGRARCLDAQLDKERMKPDGLLGDVYLVVFGSAKRR